MTAIAALISGESVYIGTDSAGISDYRLYNEKTGKVFKAGPFLIAYTESFRIGQLLQHGVKGVSKISSLKPPKTKAMALRYAIDKVIPIVRATLKVGGSMRMTSEQTEEICGFILAWSNNLFNVDIDLAVHEYVEPYMAAGCAEHCILGSFYTTEKLKSRIGPEKRVLLALEAADRHCSAVYPPFHILHT